MRTSDRMPEWTCFILCTKKTDEVKSYERIFVYGGFDILFDFEVKKMKRFMFSLGHNDGWYRYSFLYNKTSVPLYTTPHPLNYL
ncbi:unnamed protein product [marine sediment metagenome]|uniref:Uncharacterized protein n=1 Tax=marine sediment metagenome TaxID=412755 RepID=X1KH78_9ZZZZ